MLATRLLFPLPLLTLGCDHKDPVDTGSVETADTGDTTETDDFEPGCITVDGSGGYAHIADALAVASDGSVLELCAGTWEENVVVTRSVTLRGAGAGQTFISAPINEVPFTIAAAAEPGVTLADFTLSSTVTAIEVDNGGWLNVEGVAFESVGARGIYAPGNATLQVSGSTFDAMPWGAIKAGSSTLTVQDSTFDGCVSYAVHAFDGSDVTFQGNTVTDVAYGEVSSTGTVSDGYSIWLETGASLVTAGNTFTDNAGLTVFHLFADSAAQVTLQGDSFTGGYYGIAQVAGDGTWSDLTFENAYFSAVLFLGSGDDALSVDGLDVVGETDKVADIPLDEVDSDALFLGLGVFLQGDHIAVKNATVQGYNDGGMFIAGLENDAEATLESVRLLDNGRWGLIAWTTTLTATDLEVTGTQEREVQDTSDGSYDIGYPSAMSVSLANVEVRGGTLSGSGGWGFSNIQSSVLLDGMTFSDNKWSSVVDYMASTTVRGSTFTASRTGLGLGSIWAYQSSGMLLEGNQFVDNTTTDYVQEGSYIDGEGNTVEYMYDYLTPVGIDVRADYTSLLEFASNVSSNGFSSINAYNSNLDVHDNTWTGYTGYNMVYASGPGGDSLTFKDNIVDGCGGTAVGGYEVDLEVEGLQVSNGIASSYSYDYYKDGELNYTAESSYPYPAVQMYYGSALLRDIAVSNAEGTGVDLYETTAELEGVVLSGVGRAGYGSSALEFYWYSNDLELYASDITVAGNATGGGMSIYQGDSMAALEVEGLSVSDVAGYGLDLNYTSQGSFSEVRVDGASTVGVYAMSATADFAGLEVEGSGSDGIYGVSSTVTVDQSLVATNLGEGIEWVGGALTLTNSDIQDNLGTGLLVQGAQLLATGNTFSGNGSFGMQCDASVTVTECANTGMDNGLGDNLGCPASCFE